MVYIASGIGCTEIVKILLFAGADPDLGCKDSGDTPLMIASEKGHLDIVKLLIYSKCDIFSTNNKGMNTFSFACSSVVEKQYDIINFLYQSAIEMKKIDKKCKCLNDKQFATKIEQFVNQAEMENGETPYMMASKGGNKRVIKLVANIRQIMPRSVIEYLTIQSK